MKDNFEKEIARLGKALGKWRAVNSRPTPIPSEIWSGAATMARLHGVGLVARTLRLDRGKLKKLAEKNAIVKTDPSSSPTFVELKAPPVKPRSHSLSCAVEVRSVGGGVMRAQLDGLSAAELGVVFQAFGC